MPSLVNKPLGWRLAIILITGLITTPLWIVLQFNLHPRTETWQHLVDYVLLGYVTNSLILGIGVALGTFIIGVPAAWMCALYDFPAKRWLELLLLLPLAIPAYIIAYTYTGFLDVSGPLQSQLRVWFDWRYGDYWFPEIRSMGGAVAMFSFVLYPYVFLLTRSSLINQSANMIDAARSLGASPLHRFFSIVIPLSRPAIAAGVMLALMETLADYGTVQYFGIDTFTTGIFRTWFGFGEPTTAAQLASILMLVVFVLFIIERYSRRRLRFHNVSSNNYTSATTLRGKSALFAMLACFIPPLIGFIFPCIMLILWACKTAEKMIDAQFWSLALNSFLIAFLAAISTLVLAVILAYGRRASRGKLTHVLVDLSTMGYAVPGAVIAVGTLIFLAQMDHWIIDMANAAFNVELNLILTGTIAALIFAHCVRFLSISLQTVDASLTKINKSIDEAALMLGNNLWQTLCSIHLPLIRSGLLTATLLVFVEVMKELPATLIMRPFNFNTLSVRTYELASDERLADASSAALAIVLTGILPIILLNMSIRSNDRK
jgi:iron(III) transport system permease protein